MLIMANFFLKNSNTQGTVFHTKCICGEVLIGTKNICGGFHSKRYFIQKAVLQGYLRYRQQITTREDKSEAHQVC